MIFHRLADAAVLMGIVGGIQNSRGRESIGSSGDRVIENQRHLNLDEPMTRSPDDPIALIRVLAIYRPDLRGVFFERIEMHHPVEDDGMKLSACGVAFRLR